MPGHGSHTFLLKPRLQNDRNKARSTRTDKSASQELQLTSGLKCDLGRLDDLTPKVANFHGYQWFRFRPVDLQ